jgi:hypothetical protein
MSIVQEVPSLTDPAITCPCFERMSACIFSSHGVVFDCSKADDDADGLFRYIRSIGNNPVLLGVLTTLNYQARFFLHSAKVFKASDDSLADDISVSMYCVDVFERIFSAINQSANLTVDGIDPHIWVHAIVVTGWCYALLRMRPLSISYAEAVFVISCGKVEYDKYS